MLRGLLVEAAWKFKTKDSRARMLYNRLISKHGVKQKGHCGRGAQAGCAPVATLHREPRVRSRAGIDSCEESVAGSLAGRLAPAA